MVTAEQRLTIDYPVTILKPPNGGLLPKATKKAATPGNMVPRAHLRDVVSFEVQALLRSDWDDDPIGELDDETLVVLTAMAELEEEWAEAEGRAWDPSEHKRWPKGHPLGGKFRPMLELLKMAIANHDGDGHPFEHFDRTQLYKAAKARGITLKHGESKDSIAAKLLADLGAPPAKAKTKAKAPQDNLDQLSDQDLLDLAAEYGVKYLGRSREDIIADLRLKIAADKVGTDLDAVPPTGVTTKDGKTRYADPDGVPGLLKPAKDPGKSGDGHITKTDGTKGPWGKYGAAGVLLRHRGDDGVDRYLLVARGKGLSQAGKWQLPGGALDSKETAFQGATREIIEELGFNPNDVAQGRVHGFHEAEVPDTDGWKYTSIAATIPKQLQPDLSGENAQFETGDARWMTIDEIRQLDKDGKLLGPLAAGKLESQVVDLFPANKPAKKAAKNAAKKAVPAKKAAPAQPNLPGVELQRVPQVFTVAPDAYQVKLNGKEVGHIHGNEADPSFGWVPFIPTGATWNLQDPGDKPTKDAAVKELVDSFNAAQFKAGVANVDTSADAVATFPTDSALKVTTTPWAGKPFLDNKTSLMVQVGGDHIGAVHEDKKGNWTATPIGKLPGFVAPPKGATKQQAVKSLTDVIEAQVAASQAKAAVDSAIRGGDFSSLKRVGPQGGSNPGGVFEAPDGSRWYVKAQKSEAHAKNEANASALYREAGIDVPEVHRGRGLAELGNGPQTATRIIDGATSDLSATLNDPGYVAKVRRGFAVDAWLGNWDVVGLSMDNILTADGKPHRVDVGGSLLFRAQGGPKGAAFGKSVLEWATLRDPDKAPQASKFFADIAPAQLHASAQLVANIKPARIRQLVDDPDLAQLLIDRRKDILARAKKIKVPDFDARVLKAAANEQALDLARLRLDKVSFSGGLVGDIPSHWTADDADNTAEALSDYRGSDYIGINGSLRGKEPSDSNIEFQIRSLDRGMAASKFGQDVVVYRGIRFPDAVFGSAWYGSGSKAGLTWTDKGFTSTTADRRVAREGFTEEDTDSTLMRLIVPEGVGAMRLSDMAPPNHPPAGIGQEAELLLQRGLTFRVVADHGYDGTTKIRLLDVEVVPV